MKKAKYLPKVGDFIKAKSEDSYGRPFTVVDKVVIVRMNVNSHEGAIVVVFKNSSTIFDYRGKTTFRKANLFDKLQKWVEEVYVDLKQEWHYRTSGVRRRKEQIIYDAKKWYYEKTDKVVYYYYSSTDCDMCTSAGYGYTLGERAFREYEQDMYEGAEGPTQIEKISKEEYLENKDEHYFRDRIMEAYENGNGTSIIV